MQAEQQTQRIRERFQEQTGLEMDLVLAPIAPDQPAGAWLRDDAVYSQIEQARREDDATLPQGVWEHDLKKADWEEVATTTLQVLRTQSKDLQLAIWLLEAHVHRYGFAGIAPCISLISQLCIRYWEDLHPQMIDGDRDYRTNLISWINTRLQPALRLLPVTAPDGIERGFCWADWEMAQRRESILALHPEVKDLDEGATSEQIRRAILNTPNEFYAGFAEELGQAIMAMNELTAIIDRHCGRDAPSLAGIGGVLEEIYDMVCEQLSQRGIVPDEAPPDDAIDDDLPPSVTTRPVAPAGPGVVEDRVGAYAQLRHVAEFLADDDPHSPVPYLIMKAVEWGGLNTAELYHQLFVEQQGHLNIFDVLGLGQASQPPANGGNHISTEE